MKYVNNISNNRKRKVMTVFETIEQDNKRIFNNGKKKRNIEIIKNMIKENLPIELISKVTGISPQEINKMK